MKNRKNISKFLAYILRHNPGKFGLKPDKHGYVPISQILQVIREKHPNFNRNDLTLLVEKDRKNRYQIKGNQIRARYGHSINIEPELAAVKPPKNLYHGTSPTAAQKILQSGLKSMGRQFVHLSINKSDAIAVGKRYAGDPVLLKIDSQAAYKNGIKFYKEDSTYLTKFLPSQYISVISDE